MKILELFFFLIFCSSCRAENFVPTQLESLKDEEGRFFYRAIKTNPQLLPILESIDYLETGKTKASFPLVGIKAEFLVYYQNEFLILVMINPLPNTKTGSLFHLSKSKKIKNRIYPSLVPPEYSYYRIFEDEALWDSLNKALKD